MKKTIALIFIIVMFVLVGCIDTEESTKQSDIRDAQIQAEINKASR